MKKAFQITLFLVPIFNNALADDVSVLDAAVAYNPATRVDEIEVSDGVGYHFRSLDAADDLVVVGAAYDDVNGLPNAGRAYVYRVKTAENGFPFLELETILLAPDPQAFANFGLAVATDDGNAIVIGAPSHAVNGKAQSGKAYLFYRNAETGKWGLEKSFVPDDTPQNPSTNDFFGYSVAVANDVVVIGAPYDDNLDVPNTGRTHVYYRHTATPFTMVTSKRGEQSGERLGYSVAVTNHFGTDGSLPHLYDFLVVSGAPGATHVGHSANSGGVLLTYFDHQLQWTHQPYVPRYSLHTGDEFGREVDVRSSMLVVGVPGRDILATDDGVASIYNVRDYRAEPGLGVTVEFREHLFATNESGLRVGTDHGRFGSSLDLTGYSTPNVLDNHVLAIGEESGFRSFSRLKFGSQNIWSMPQEPGADSFGISVAIGDTGSGVPYKVILDPDHSEGMAKIFLYTF